MFGFISFSFLYILNLRFINHFKPRWAKKKKKDTRERLTCISLLEHNLSIFSFVVFFFCSFLRRKKRKIKTSYPRKVFYFPITLFSSYTSRVPRGLDSSSEYLLFLVNKDFFLVICNVAT